MKLSYLEAISHVRKYKDIYRLGAIANLLEMNQGQFRQVVNQIGYAQELPEKYRSEFIRIVSDLCKVEQIEPEWYCEGLRD